MKLPRSGTTPMATLLAACLAAVSFGGEELQDGRPKLVPATESLGVRFAVVAPDDQLVGAAFEDGRVVLLAADDGEQVGELGAIVSGGEVHTLFSDRTTRW